MGGVKMTEQEYLQSIKADETEPNPSYYTILTADVRYSNEISDFEKILYSEIVLLVKAKGFCFASNNYFAKFFNKSKDYISRSINNLKRAGFVDTEIIYKDNSKEIVGRIIKTKLPERFTNSTISIAENNDTPIAENNDTPIAENNDTPIDQKREDNNINNNNTSLRESDARAREHSKNSIFENFITDFLVYYQKLTGHAISDINQAPFFRALRNREELKSIFEARRYNYKQCLKSAFEFAEKRPPDKRFFSFWDTLKIYLQNGNDGQIARYYTEAERQERENIAKQKAEAKKNAEIEKLWKEYNEAERLGLSVAEYRRMLELEEDAMINDLKKNLFKIAGESQNTIKGA